MTVGSSVFWIYLVLIGWAAGLTALVLGLVARFTSCPFDTPGRLRLLLILLGLASVVGLAASALSFHLAVGAGAFLDLLINSLIGPFAACEIAFVWASGFPILRVFRRGR